MTGLGRGGVAAAAAAGGMAAVALAYEEAARLRHGYLGTEHLVLGVLREARGPGARALASLGVALDDARAMVGQVVGVGSVAVGGHLPATPRARAVLAAAEQEAADRGDARVGSGHLLLALTHKGDGIGLEVLARLGAPALVVAARVREAMAGPVPAPRDVPSPRDDEERLARLEAALDDLRDRLERVAAEVAALRRRLRPPG